jgi:hypothetical protein
MYYSILFCETKTDFSRAARSLRKEFKGRGEIFFNWSPSRDHGFVGIVFAGTPSSYDDGYCLRDEKLFYSLLNVLKQKSAADAFLKAIREQEESLALGLCQSWDDVHCLRPEDSSAVRVYWDAYHRREEDCNETHNQ